MIEPSGFSIPSSIPTFAARIVDHQITTRVGAVIPSLNRRLARGQRVVEDPDTQLGGPRGEEGTVVVAVDPKPRPRLPDRSRARHRHATAEAARARDVKPRLRVAGADADLARVARVGSTSCSCRLG